MSDISTWSTTAASNNSVSPDGFPEGMAPSGVNNSAREVMAAVRTQHEDAQWIDLGDTPTFASTTAFTVVGDLTGTYDIGRRIKATDASTLYGEITNSVFSSPNTTVTVALDSGVLSGSLTAVALGIVSGTNSSLRSSRFIQEVETSTGAVSTGATQFPFDDSIPQSSEGDQYLSQAITPLSTSNILVIEVVINTSVDIAATQSMGLFQDSTAGALAAVAETTANASEIVNLKLTHTMTAGTTSATTFKVRAGNSLGGIQTTTLNGIAAARRFGGVMSSTLKITEYQA